MPASVRSRPSWCSSSGGDTIASDLAGKNLLIVENAKASVANPSLYGSIGQVEKDSLLSGTELSNLSLP